MLKTRFISDSISTPMIILVASAIAFAPVDSNVATSQSRRPPAGVTLPGRVVDVYDGDTITVEVTMKVRVRLLDCWAPEIRGVDNKEKERGFESRDYLRNIALNKQCILHVPTKGDGRLDKHFSFGRVLGHVWVKDDEQNLSTKMIEAGHATKNKE